MNSLRESPTYWLINDTILETKAELIPEQTEYLNAYVLEHSIGISTDAELVAAQQAGILQTSVVNAIDDLLDAEAKKNGYSSIISATSYAGYPNDFQAEGLAYGTWRSAVWAYCYQELDKIQQGLRTIPTLEEFIGELPALTLPAA